MHTAEADRVLAIADAVASGIAHPAGTLTMADTREQVTQLNQAIRDRLVAHGAVDDTHVVVTDAGERIGVGDRVATRRNDYDLGVANRDAWTVTAVQADGRLRLNSPRGERVVPAIYVQEHVELAYATTVYGAQGETTGHAHVAVGEHSTAASAYVGMTRGRHDNTAHLVAESPADARRQWIEVFGTQRADLGPAHAARLAAQEVSRYGPTRPLDAVRPELWRAWAREEELSRSIAQWTVFREDLGAGPETVDRRQRTEQLLAELEADLGETRRQLAAVLREPAVRVLGQDGVAAERDAWTRQRTVDAHRARERAAAAARARNHHPAPTASRGPALGPGIRF